jgi:hypothetical protein
VVQPEQLAVYVHRLVKTLGLQGRPPDEEGPKRIRLYELAHELGVDVRLVIDIGELVGVTVSKNGTATSLSNEDAETIRDAYFGFDNRAGTTPS